MNKNLPDIQGTSPIVPGYINYVGVSDVKVPFKIESRYGGCHEMVASVSMSCDLNENIKGISMSRLIRILKDYLDKPLKRDILKDILYKFKDSSIEKSNNTFIRFEFLLPIFKKSPKSNYIFPQYYECKFEGRLQTDNFRFFEGVRIQYSSYCPCSASLCNNLIENNKNGFPHAQRSFCDLLIECNPDNIIWLEDLIVLIETDVINIPYPIILRVDEQEVARIAYENPMFVEDVARRISKSLNERNDIKDWIFKCIHEESIHTSTAVVECWKNIEDGFDGTYFL